MSNQIKFKTIIMSTTEIAKETVYYTGTIGFAPNLLSTVVNFSLLVHPYNNSVSGTVKINVGTTKESYIGEVTGKTYATGLGDSVRLLRINGNIPSNSPITPLNFPFEATMNLKADWDGKGGFSFLGEHKEDQPVSGKKYVLDNANVAS